MNIVDLRHRLDSYLELRKQIGFKVLSEERYLRDFLHYLENRLLDPVKLAQLAVDWASRSQPSQARRLSFVRRFLIHLRASFPDVTVPGLNLLSGFKRPTPHIYSEQEIQSLLSAALLLEPRGSLRPLTYFTLIGLVASCGLRANEAIQLRNGDWDLDSNPPRFYVNKTKFRKSRIVPVHKSTAEAIRKYIIEKERLGYNGSCDFFFVSEQRNQLHYHTVARTFISLARQVGIRGPKGERGPRLHDLRHTFAVKRMITWYQQGADVQACLPELSVYIGHVRPEETYWYLTATPELLSLAAERFEQYDESGGSL